MALVRVLSHEDSTALGAHLRRAGSDPSAAEGAAHLTVMLTAVPADAAAALDAALGEAGAPRRLAGSSGEPGAALVLAGERGRLAAFGATLRGRGAAAAALADAVDRALECHARPAPPLQIGQRRFAWGERTFVMGVVNVTPDSFSDGGRFFDRDAAVRQGVALAQAGADLLDVGGESTRPGAETVLAAEEAERVLPVIERLRREVDVPISVDTTKAAVADAALLAGASMVNDVSGFKFDEQMAPAIARHGAAACAMHLQGTPRSMQSEPRYFDVVGEVVETLAASLDSAARAGVASERVLVDPGIGFGKTAGHNLFLLRHLRQLRALGRPIVVGTSRKSFLGKLTGRPVDGRLAGTLASVAAAVLAGADVVRVHDVAQAVDAVRVADAIARAAEGGFLYDRP